MYALISPIKPAAVLKYLGLILIGMGIVQAAPLTAALVYGAISAAVIYGLLAGALVVLGFSLTRLFREYELEVKEAVVLAAAVFPLSAFIAAIPIQLTTDMPFLDAFFESVSGLTTTGLSVAPPETTQLFLFARSWLQWIGGIGIVVLVLSIFIRPGTSAFRIFAANVGENKIKPSVIKAAKMLGKVYIVLTVIAFLLLLLAGMSPFDALCHAFSSVSTGGFSTRAESIGAFSGTMIPLVITFCCVLGAISFPLYPLLLKDPRMLFRDIQVRYFVLIAIAGIVLCGLTFRAIYPAVGEAAAFQALQALTTAGFSTIEIRSLPESSKFILTVLMWIGGEVGSTAGGIKIFRAVVLLKMVHLGLLRLFLPREVVTPLKVGKEVIEQEELNQISTFIFLYFVIVILSMLVFLLMGVGMSDALFEVSSALGTVGLSSGVTSASMPAILKIVLCADMLLGRIDVVPLLILFMPRTWVKIRKRGGS
jgi:trk system potassium uptake protein TrkH